MLRQIQYFQAVVRNNSFSEAAEECHISQSAVSQQVKALEQALGFPLLERKNRKFVLTPAGTYFYQKSLVLVADYEQMCREAAKIARGDGAVLKIGYPRDYSGDEIRLALDEFAAAWPAVAVQLLRGSHEELFRLLRSGGADLVLNDQRRAFSDEYVNLILATGGMCVEISARSAMAELPSVTAAELKNLPCILISSGEEWETEQEYYRSIVGLSGQFLRAGHLDEARLLVVSGQGVLPVEGTDRPEPVNGQIRRIPLFRGAEQITRTDCLFWKKVNSGPALEAFARILKSKFS